MLSIFPTFFSACYTAPALKKGKERRENRRQEKKRKRVATLISALTVFFAYHEINATKKQKTKTKTRSGLGLTSSPSWWSRRVFFFLQPKRNKKAGLARVGVVGVSSLAILSGFSAVNLPYQQIATLFRRVPPR